MHGGILPVHSTELAHQRMRQLRKVMTRVNEGDDDRDERDMRNELEILLTPDSFADTQRLTRSPLCFADNVV